MDASSEGGRAAENQQAFWIGGSMTQSPAPGGRLFRICVIPVFKEDGSGDLDKEQDAVEVALSRPPSEVAWYIYAVLDHGYCDGPTGLPLFADLLRLYAEETGENEGDEATQLPDALEVLQGRLQRSLQPMPEAEHPNDDIFHDDLATLGYHKGFTRFIQFEQKVMYLLRFAAKEMLGCSVDVAWLTAISTAFLRLFPDLKRLDLYLIVTCRDKPTEELMIGYFSSRKVLPVDVGDPRQVAILGLADIISTARRMRAWHRPRPFEKFGAIEVNVVSQAADGLPFGFQEVRCPRNAPRDWGRGGTSRMVVRLDQTARDAWDFRLQSHDAKWGENWSTYFVQALGSSIVDMALHPTGPVVPSADA